MKVTEISFCLLFISYEAVISSNFVSFTKNLTSLIGCSVMNGATAGGEWKTGGTNIEWNLEESIWSRQEFAGAIVMVFILPKCNSDLEYLTFLICCFHSRC